MKTYITSDLHFGHTNIMKFCPKTRGHYKDVAHMHSEMIRMWNETVNSEDTVYILGDVAFLPADQAVSILKRLNGSLILIEGNHDRKALKDPEFRKCFVEIHKYYEITYNKTFVVMGHYPFLEWNRMHRGSVNLYGHLHGATTGMEKYRSRDVGMDATGKVVSLLDDVIADALKGEIKGHH
jgi:calcineurin-like phosphoesterase family protein